MLSSKGGIAKSNSFQKLKLDRGQEWMRWEVSKVNPGSEDQGKYQNPIPVSRNEVMTHRQPLWCMGWCGAAGGSRGHPGAFEEVLLPVPRAQGWEEGTMGTPCLSMVGLDVSLRAGQGRSTCFPNPALSVTLEASLRGPQTKGKGVKQVKMEQRLQYQRKATEEHRGRKCLPATRVLSC